MTTTLAFCLIVKNESRFLDACLSSIKDRADKIIVVDTGSTDDTVEIAKRHGAEVRYFPWTGNFAAARNESIRDVGTDWFFIIDADEVLGPGDIRAELEALHARGQDGALVDLHNASILDTPPEDVLAGKTRIGIASQVPRLIRNGDGVQFTGSVHEDVSEWLKARGMRVAFIKTPLVHYGSCPEVLKFKQKETRNIDMLKVRIEKEPDNITLYGYLTLEMMGRFPDAEVLEWANKGWEHAEKRPLKGTLARLGVTKATLEQRLGNTDAAFEAVELMWTMEGASPDSDFLAASTWVQQAEDPKLNEEQRRRCYVEALSHYEFALNPIEWESRNYYIAGSSSFGSWAGAGHCLSMLGFYDRAEAAFKKSLELCPDFELAVNGLSMLAKLKEAGV